MQDEAIYGLVYKHIREKRGFTQKEAAGKTVTTQFLRQFEQGKSRITLQKFEEILANIGIDKADFDKTKTQLYPSNFHKLQEQVASLVYKREYQKILSLISKPLENPGVSEHYVIANRVINKFAIANIIGDSFLTEADYQELDYIKNYLSELEVWNTIEVNIFTSILPHFSIEFLDYRLPRLLETFRQDTEIHADRAADYYFSCLKIAVRHYSTHGYYDKAEKLATQTLELIHDFPLLSIRMMEILNFSMERANNFLRQDNPKGVEIAQQIFTTMESLERVYPNPVLTRMREDFFQTATQLNKTGQPITF